MTHSHEAYDLIVVGGGPGGYPLAARMAREGWKTALIEQPGEHGGTCLNWGCIPTKALLASAQNYHFLKNAEQWGLKAGEPGFDWSVIQTRKSTITGKLRQGIVQMLKKAGVSLYEGTARLVSAGTVEVAQAEGEPVSLSANKICLAIGSKPARPNWIPENKELFWTSDEALGATAIPETLLIVGGGVIGLELGQVFADFGAKVTIVELLPQILPGLDSATAKRLMPVFRKAGLEILTGSKVEHLSDEQGRVKALINGEERGFERCLIAVGRQLNRSVFTEDGPQPDIENGILKVSETYETSIPQVFAIGDAIPGPMLAHKATYDAWILGEQWLGKSVTPSYKVVPSCVYTHPEIAWVGLSEEQAKEQGLTVHAGRSMFSANGKALASGHSEGQVKTFLGEDGQLLGAVIWGPEASNLIMEPTLMIARHIGADEFLSVIHPHPTLSEAFLEAVASGRGVGVHG